LKRRGFRDGSRVKVNKKNVILSALAGSLANRPAEPKDPCVSHEWNKGFGEFS
jgi:hypothetical protein